MVTCFQEISKKENTAKEKNKKKKIKKKLNRQPTHKNRVEGYIMRYLKCTIKMRVFWCRKKMEGALSTQDTK